MAPKLEITPPDISPYAKGNADCDYVHRFDSGKPGPNVLITALIHGNEICGAVALDYLLKKDIRPQVGSLTLCFANVDAYGNFDPRNPQNARFVDEDMNRLWSPHQLNADKTSVELRRARAILPIVDDADCLLDLHSMSEDSAPLALAGRRSKNLDEALDLGLAPYVIRDDGHIAGKRLRDYLAFDNPDSPKSALLVECGAHWKKESAEFAIQISLGYLQLHGLISTETAIDLGFSPQDIDQTVLDVTHTITAEHENFLFTRPVHSLECIPKAGTEIGVDGDKTITTPYDDCYIIMPQPGAQRGRTAARLARLVDA